MIWFDTEHSLCYCLRKSLLKQGYIRGLTEFRLCRQIFQLSAAHCGKHFRVLHYLQRYSFFNRQIARSIRSTLHSSVDCKKVPHLYRISIEDKKHCISKTFSGKKRRLQSICTKSSLTSPLTFYTFSLIPLHSFTRNLVLSLFLKHKISGIKRTPAPLAWLFSCLTNFVPINCSIYKEIVAVAWHVICFKDTVFLASKQKEKSSPLKILWAYLLSWFLILHLFSLVVLRSISAIISL